MAVERFIDSLRLASRLLISPKVNGEQGGQTDAYLASMLHAGDLWLTPKAIEGFDPADFTDWPKQDRVELAREVTAFLGIAEQVPEKKSATATQSKQARMHLEGAIRIVRNKLLHEWLDAQKKLMKVARAAAETKGWYVQMDEKEVSESLLGRYKAPRLRVRTNETEVVLDPVARFGSGRRGVVDLVLMPAYETVYLITFKGDSWHIVSPHGTANSRPFTQATFINTITRLSLTNAPS